MDTTRLEAFTELVLAQVAFLPDIDLEYATTPGDILLYQEGTWLDCISWAINVQPAHLGTFRITVQLTPLYGEDRRVARAFMYRPATRPNHNYYAGVLLWSMLRSAAIHLSRGTWELMVDNSDNSGSAATQRDQ